jgi:hypothetical protein
MATSLTPERRRESENAHKAVEEIVLTGSTKRRCLRDGGELRVIGDASLGYRTGYQVLCEREQRVIATTRA